MYFTTRSVPLLMWGQLMSNELEGYVAVSSRAILKHFPVVWLEGLR
jgi:hypothetical protein